MAVFIKAEPGMKHSVIYTDEAGQYFRYSGGTWAWRNQNPGNIRPGNMSRKQGQINKITHARREKSGCICDYYVDPAGWVIKEQYIALAKLNQVELEVCTSRLGHTYLKAPPRSFFQTNLKNLVEKKPRG